MVTMQTVEKVSGSRAAGFGNRKYMRLGQEKYDCGVTNVWQVKKHWSLFLLNHCQIQLKARWFNLKESKLHWLPWIPESYSVFDKKNTHIQFSHESSIKCCTVQKKIKCDWHSEKSHLLCTSHRWWQEMMGLLYGKAWWEERSKAQRTRWQGESHRTDGQISELMNEYMNELINK